MIHLVISQCIVWVKYIRDGNQFCWLNSIPVSSLMTKCKVLLTAPNISTQLTGWLSVLFQYGYPSYNLVVVSFWNDSIIIIIIVVLLQKLLDLAFSQLNIINRNGLTKSVKIHDLILVLVVQVSQTVVLVIVFSLQCCDLAIVYLSRSQKTILKGYLVIFYSQLKQWLCPNLGYKHKSQNDSGTNEVSSAVNSSMHIDKLWQGVVGDDDDCQDNAGHIDCCSNVSGIIQTLHLHLSY